MSRLEFPARNEELFTAEKKVLTVLDDVTKDDFLKLTRPDEAGEVNQTRWKEDKEAIELQAEFERLARDTPCTQSSTQAQVPLWGVGSNVQSALKSLTQAFEWNQSWVTPVDALGHPFTAYGLRATSSCPPSHGTEEVQHCYEKMGCWDILCDACPPWAPGHPNEPPPARLVPGKYQHRGLFWWTAQQYSWYLTPGKDLSDRIEQEKKHLDWENNRPILALHVRHGDTCGDTFKHDRHCSGLDEYMQHALLMQKQFGYKSIYLATDDHNVVLETKNWPQFKWLLSNATNAQKFFAKDTSNFEDQVRDGKVDLVAESKEILQMMHVMSDADGLLGKMSSTIDMIVYPLSYGKKQCQVPLKTLDLPWRHDWGRASKDYSGRHFWQWKVEIW